MQLDALFAAAAQRADQPRIDSISVGEDLHLVLPPGQLNYFGNHSCNSNPWWVDAYTLAARRPITAGEEVTSDRGTSTAVTGFSMSCNADRRIGGQRSPAVTGNGPISNSAAATTGSLCCSTALGKAALARLPDRSRGRCVPDRTISVAALKLSALRSDEYHPSEQARCADESVLALSI